MKIRESVRKYIFLGVFCFIVLGILLANILANNQDKQFAMKDVLYQQTLNLVSEGKYNEASQITYDLLNIHQDSSALNYLAGLIAANTGEMEQATIYFQRVLDLNPYRVEEPMFMLQFGETLFKSGSYQNA
ncbi:hypothetical protein D7X33_45990, partial [Butyricicoccus sp. 1XD8-22]